MAARVLLVVGADAGSDGTATPERDYAALARTLDATLLDRRAIGRSRIARLIGRIAGLGAAEAWVAFTHRHGHDVIVTDGEHAGIALALLLRFGRARQRHVTIGHRLSSRKKRAFFRMLRVQSRIDRIVVHSRTQLAIATESLGVDRRRLALVPYQVDATFWSPRRAEEERLIASVGLEHRDYATLLRAAAGVDASFVIGAASHWSRHSFANTAVPPNVSVGSFDYAALRDLYARAAIVVVPLHDVDNQAGITTILEAMAMAKPVIVTQSRGQTDVIEDRRGPERGEPRPRPTSLARTLAAEIGFALEANGFYVPPYDAAALARAIRYLLQHPDERRRLGAAGRRAVERLFTVERFAMRMREVVMAAAADGDAHRAQLRYRRTDA